MQVRVNEEYVVRTHCFDAKTYAEHNRPLSLCQIMNSIIHT